MNPSETASPASQPIYNQSNAHQCLRYLERIQRRSWRVGQRDFYGVAGKESNVRLLGLADLLIIERNHTGPRRIGTVAGVAEDAAFLFLGVQHYSARISDGLR